MPYTYYRQTPSYVGSVRYAGPSSRQISRLRRLHNNTANGIIGHGKPFFSCLDFEIMPDEGYTTDGVTINTMSGNVVMNVDCDQVPVSDLPMLPDRPEDGDGGDDTRNVPAGRVFTSKVYGFGIGPMRNDFRAVSRHTPHVTGHHQFFQTVSRTIRVSVSVFMYVRLSAILYRMMRKAFMFSISAEAGIRKSGHV